MVGLLSSFESELRAQSPLFALNRSELLPVLVAENLLLYRSSDEVGAFLVQDRQPRPVDGDDRTVQVGGADAAGDGLDDISMHHLQVGEIDLLSLELTGDQQLVGSEQRGERRHPKEAGQGNQDAVREARGIGLDDRTAFGGDPTETDPDHHPYIEHKSHRSDDHPRAAAQEDRSDDNDDDVKR